jgi:hypothetical protein
MRILAIILFINTVFTLHAQQSDTLELARNQANNGAFKTAIELLDALLQKRNDVHAYRLQAQVLYWNKEFGRARATLSRAIKLFPVEQVLFLEYGRLLYNTGLIRQAEEYLHLYAKHDPTHAETILMRSYIAFWQGNFKKVSQILPLLLQKYPEQKEGLLLQEQVLKQQAAYLELLPQYQSDDQPLAAQTINAEAGIYRSEIFSPRLQVQSRHFISEGNTYPINRLEVGNTFQNSTFGFRFSLQGGALHATNSSNPQFIGKAVIRQILHRNWTAELIMARTPYMHTLAAARKPFLMKEYALNLEWKQSEKWIGKGSWNMQAFDDGNQVYSAYGWLGFPLVFESAFRLQAGYSFSWQNAFENKAGYSLPGSLTEIYNKGLTVPTIYESYFTPKNMLGNAGFATLEWSPSKFLSFSSRFSYAFHAQADVPYFYVDRRGAAISVYKDYFTYQFHPIDAEAALKIRPSQQAELAAIYQYQSILFYKLQLIQLQFKYRFYRAVKSTL